MVSSNLTLPATYPTVVHMLAASTASHPDAVAVTHQGTEISYRELWERIARKTDALGRRSGDRVAVVMGNSLETVITYFAVLKSGAQLVVLNPSYTATELRTILDDSAPAIVIHDDTATEAVNEAVGGSAAPVVVLAGYDRLGDARDDDLENDLDLDPDSLALLQYTGGTSGIPKGVNLTHRSLAINVAQREALLPTDMGQERVLCVMPIFHSYALCMGIFLAFNSGSTLVLQDRYRPTDVFAAVREHQITVFPGNPTIFTGLLSHPEFDSADWATVHTCYSGSAPLPAGTLSRWEAAVGAPIYEGYGQTEAGSILTFNPSGGNRKVGSVGVPVAGTEVQVVDLDTGTVPVPTQKLGEVRARGPQIMQAYRDRPQETSEALRDGWLYTGDIGYLDDEGYLFIQDRKKEMCIVGGYNVYPREVEESIFLHPAISDVAVVGIPDPYRGEVLHAFVAPRQDTEVLEEELRTYCMAHLARYKVPTAFHILPTLPKTAANKTNKIALRASLEDTSSGKADDG